MADSDHDSVRQEYEATRLADKFTERSRRPNDQAAPGYPQGGQLSILPGTVIGYKSGPR